LARGAEHKLPAVDHEGQITTLLHATHGPDKTLAACVTTRGRPRGAVNAELQERLCANPIANDGHAIRTIAHNILKPTLFNSREHLRSPLQHYNTQRGTLSGSATQRITVQKFQSLHRRTPFAPAPPQHGGLPYRVPPPALQQTVHHWSCNAVHHDAKDANGADKNNLQNNANRC
jgi:hypothetical protein